MKNCHDYFARKFSTYNFLALIMLLEEQVFAPINGYLWIEEEKNCYAEKKRYHKLYDRYL